MLLLKHGAHLDAANTDGKTPLDVCEPQLRKTLMRMAESG